MSVYRLTRFASSDMNKVSEYVDSIKDELKALNSDFIDVVSYGNGKGVVIARYPDQATMDAAAETAKTVLGKMVESGLIDGDSIHPHTGDVLNSV